MATLEANKNQQVEVDGASLTGEGEGPPVRANWVAANCNSPLLETLEFRLFTDAHVTGESSRGPYQFLNTVPKPEPRLVQPAVLLRVDIRIGNQQADITKTDTKSYHAGTFPEEVAALASLVLGIRLRAGNVCRRFEPGGDSKGRPSEWDSNPVAGMLIGRDRQRLVVPNASGIHGLDALNVLSGLPRMSASDAAALVKAARLYQDALWLVESEPELAWLMLVSAVETAANRWGRRAKGTPAERLRDSKPELYELLHKTGVPGLIDDVANEIADSLGATRKFVTFVLNFLPTPPTNRPPQVYQVDWGPEGMREKIRVVYKYRSKALHEGTPFPFPMCEAPFSYPEWDAPSERPVGEWTSASGGAWMRKDTPILLHVFEYIARNCILAWWSEVSQQHQGEETRDASI